METRKIKVEGKVNKKRVMRFEKKDKEMARVAEMIGGEVVEGGEEDAEG